MSPSTLLFLCPKVTSVKVFLEVKGCEQDRCFFNLYTEAQALSLSLCFGACRKCHRWTRHSLSLAEGRWHNMRAQMACHRTATGSRRLDHFLCAKRPQFCLHNKDRDLRTAERESSLCGAEREGGWKIAWVHQFSLIPTGTINVSGKMSYLWQAVPQAGFFFPLSLWWVSGTWTDKADRGCAIRWQSG